MIVTTAASPSASRIAEPVSDIANRVSELEARLGGPAEPASGFSAVEQHERHRDHPGRS